MTCNKVSALRKVAGAGSKSKREVLHKDRQKNMTERSSLDVLHHFYFLTEYPLPLPEYKQKIKILISKTGNNCFYLSAIDKLSIKKTPIDHLDGIQPMLIQIMKFKSNIAYEIFWNT